MSTKDTAKCSAEAYESIGSWGKWRPCSRKGTVQEDGKDWCWQHAPSAKKARDEAGDALYRQQTERLLAPGREIQHLREVNRDLLAALKALDREYTRLCVDTMGVASNRPEIVQQARDAIAKAEHPITS